MNLFAPVSSLMTDHKDLITVNPDDPLTMVKDIFEKHNFHHVPVVHFREIVGIISKTDFYIYVGGNDSNTRLTEGHAKDIMTTRMGKVESTDRLNVVVDIFTLNRFHALPVVDDGELTGIITPYDILRALSKEKPADPTSVYETTTM